MVCQNLAELMNIDIIKRLISMVENIAKIFLEPIKPSQTTEIFVANNEESEESGLGHFFIMISVESREKGLKEKIKEFIDWAEKTYYASPVPNVESSLETVCQQINQAWFDFFNKPALWLQKVNILVGVIADDVLVFSNSGHFSGYLVRNKKINSILAANQFSLEDKILTQITSGEILPGDAIIFANYNLFDFFSLEKIREVLSKLNADQASEHFKNLLQESAHVPLINGIILKASGVELEIEKNKVDNRKYLEEWFGSRESMQQLDNLEKRTGRTLTASVWPNIQKIVRLLFFWRHRRKDDKKETKNLKLPQIKEKKDTAKIFKKIKNLITNFWGLIGKTITNSIKNRQLLLIVIIVLIIAIGGSVAYLRWHQDKVKVSDFYQQIFREVADNKTAAEAALIYNDKEKATEFLTVAKELISNNLTTKTPEEWRMELEKKQIEVLNLWNKINNIYQIGLENEIDLFLTGEQQVNQIMIDKDNIYALTNLGVMYQVVDNATKEIWRQDKINICGFDQKSQFVCQDQDNNFWLRNILGEFKKINVVLNGTATKFIVYNDRIYALDNNKPFLVKVNNPWGDAPEVVSWYEVKKEILLGVKDMAIDGNIWLAKEGEVIKLFKGKSENFQLLKLDKPLGKNILIETNSDISLIYILDADNQRLIVSDKNGNIQKQFINENLRQAKSIGIMVNAVCFTDGKKIYRFDWENN